jgi:hypothetical protein
VRVPPCGWVQGTATGSSSPVVTDSRSQACGEWTSAVSRPSKHQSWAARPARSTIRFSPRLNAPITVCGDTAAPTPILGSTRPSHASDAVPKSAGTATPTSRHRMKIPIGYSASSCPKASTCRTYNPFMFRGVLMHSGKRPGGATGSSANAGLLPAGGQIGETRGKRQTLERLASWVIGDFGCGVRTCPFTGSLGLMPALALPELLAWRCGWTGFRVCLFAGWRRVWEPAARAR